MIFQKCASLALASAVVIPQLPRIGPGLEPTTEALMSLPEQGLLSEQGLMDEDEQIKYVLGRWTEQKFEMTQGWDEFLDSRSKAFVETWRHFSVGGGLIEHDSYAAQQDEDSLRFIYTDPFLSQLGEISETSAPHCTAGKEFLVLTGDSAGRYEDTHPTATLAKARRVGEDNLVVMQFFEYERHWLEACDMMSETPKIKDIPWNEKKPVAIFRGGTTGMFKNQREPFVKQYFNSSRSDVDVGFSKICDGGEGLEDWVKDHKSIEDQLGHKYIVLHEGNDVASGLNWALASNSMVIMPKPQMESAALEGSLLSGVHYKELKWSDEKGWNLEELLDDCIKDEEHCKKIAEHGKQFIQHYQFCDDEYQQKLAAKILDKYCEQTNIQLS